MTSSDSLTRAQDGLHRRDTKLWKRRLSTARVPWAKCERFTSGTNGNALAHGEIAHNMMRSLKSFRLPISISMRLTPGVATFGSQQKRCSSWYV
jgi:hypothetical protein